MGSGGRDAHGQVPKGGRTHGHDPGRRAGIPPLPTQPLVQALEHQPAWAGQRRTERCAGRIQFIKRRTLVVGIFPNDAAITRLVGAVLLEQDEHWQMEGRRMFSLDSMAAIPPSAEALPEPDRERGAMP